ncbi:MAG: hypothetical protein GXY83_42540, partial [Rhodopirellula sp.]|nr:hypothetical protein [Rhodopirellula sp.]
MHWFAGFRRCLRQNVRGARDDDAVSLSITTLESRRVLSASAVTANLDAAIGDSGGAGSGGTLIMADSAVPVFEIMPASLEGWRQEDYQTGSGDWRVDPTTGTVVTQVYNGQPTVFYSDFPVTADPFEVTIKVTTTSDDDFIGFVLGFEPGDFSSANADYLVIDWRQANGTGGGAQGLKGLAVSRVTGRPDTQWDFWGHQDGVTELARATTLGSEGWVDNVEYRFTVQYSADRLLIYVNGQLEFDIAAPANDPFPGGRLGFYNYSQPDTAYSATRGHYLDGEEGSAVAFTRNFTYAGSGDDLSASIDWGDGTTSPGTIDFANGAGTLSGIHTYADNGQYSIRYILEANDSGRATGWTTADIVNVAPTLTVVGNQATSEGAALSIEHLGTFTDPGFDRSPTQETFSYTIDWGDGTAADAGAATIATAGSA